MPETKKLCVVERNYVSRDLPSETLLQIFGYFNLETWKNARGVSHRWNQLLCHAAFSLNIALTIRNCTISRNSSPMTLFSSTFSFFPTVKIKGNVQWKSEEELLEFLEKIGNETLHLKITDEDFALSDALDKFPALKTIESPSTILYKSNIPKTVKTFILKSLSDYTRGAAKYRIDKLLQDPLTKIIVKSIKIEKKTYNTWESFIGIDWDIRSISKELKSTIVKIVPIDIREKRKIVLSDVMDFKDYIWTADASEDSVFWKFFSNMKNLQTFNVIIAPYADSPYCFFTHKPIRHEEIKTFMIEGPYRTCKKCLTSALNSFPNLNYYHASDLDSNLDYVLNQDIVLEKILIKNGYVYLEPLLQFPADKLQKLSNLTFLYLSGMLDDDNINWLGLFEKWPMMPKMINLTMDPVSDIDFEALYVLFKKCPNVQYFRLSIYDGLGIDEMIKVLKLWPQLKRLDLETFNWHCYRSKRFIEAIAPFVKHLQEFSCMNQREDHDDPNYPEIETLTLEECEIQMERSIPSLRSIDLGW